jgi:outer membrane lipoprotein-sorting protein
MAERKSVFKSLAAALASAAFLLAVFPLEAPAQGETRSEAQAQPAKLSAEDTADLARVESYLNAIRTLRSHYFQINPDGSMAEGTFYLSRPGKLRFDYDPPTPILVVGDGTWLHYHDRELGQVNDYPIFDTPIGVLAEDRIRFEPPVLVMGVVRQPGVLRIRLAEEKDPGQGSLELTFEDHPLALKQWSLVDPQGRTTTVAFLDMTTNLKLDDRLFVFDDPRAKAVPGRNTR